MRRPGPLPNTTRLLLNDVSRPEPYGRSVAEYANDGRRGSEGKDPDHNTNRVRDCQRLALRVTDSVVVWAILCGEGRS